MDRITEHLPPDPADEDPTETAEWREALQSLVATEGPARARALLDELARTAHGLHVGWQPERNGDLALEERLGSLMRWNALAMVVRANQAHGELGGHIASYASGGRPVRGRLQPLLPPRLARSTAATWCSSSRIQRARRLRARLPRRAAERGADLAHYRQETRRPGGTAARPVSYPHPWLMPDFWQFPTGSMGIGPISAIYQARFMRYLSTAACSTAAGRKVWGVFGDGEMDEPESIDRALTLAAREGWTTWSGWSTATCSAWTARCAATAASSTSWSACSPAPAGTSSSCLWGSDWDGLFARDPRGALVRAFAQTVDGQMQTFAAKDGRYNREQLLRPEPRTGAPGRRAMTDEQIDRLKRGGHDLVKIHAAYAAAARTAASPP
jgi:pyruvate dehydrogenase E1 component